MASAAAAAHAQKHHDPRKELPHDSNGGDLGGPHGDFLQEWQALQEEMRADLEAKLAAQDRLIQTFCASHRFADSELATPTVELAATVAEEEPAESDKPTATFSATTAPRSNRSNRSNRSLTAQDSSSGPVKLKGRNSSVSSISAMLHFSGLNMKDYLYTGGGELDFRGKVLRRLFDMGDWWAHLREPHRKGRLARLILSSGFEIMVLLVVIFNCCFILYAEDYSIQHLNEDTPDSFITLEALFTLFFTFELILRLVVHRFYFFVNHEMGWNLADFSLVLLMYWHLIMLYVGETQVVQLTFLRSFRILRVARILSLLRMVRVFADLRIMVNAFLNSWQSLMWSFMLLIFTIAMFAMVIVQRIEEFLAQHVDDECGAVQGCLFNRILHHFGSISRCMLSLYMSTTGGLDWYDFYDALSATGDKLLPVVFVFYTAFYYFGIFNLLTGIFVDKVVRAAQPDADQVVFDQRREEQECIQGFLRLFADFDLDHDGCLEESEYQRVIESDSGRIYLGMLGLQPKDTKVMFQSLQAIHPKVPVSEFVQGCMRMRSGSHSVDLQSINFHMGVLHELLNGLTSSVTDVRGAISDMKKDIKFHVELAEV